MTLYEKQQWLERQGKVTFYCRIASSAPYVRWSSRGATTRLSNITVPGDGYDSINDLYAAVKNRLFSICLVKTQ